MRQPSTGWPDEIGCAGPDDFQHLEPVAVGQFFARDSGFLEKFTAIKDLLGRMHGSDIPLTDGFRDVTWDYLAIWGEYDAELTRITTEEVAAFNAIANAAGVAAVRIPERGQSR